MLDAVGYAQLGCYGSDIATPTIDRLAADGVRLANFHTTALCSPTRACLLTGRNHHRNGMGRVADLAMGYPGYWGLIPRANGRTAAMTHILDLLGRLPVSDLPAVAELIENVGGSLSVGSSGATVKVLAPERSLGLSILFACLAQANFPQDAFAREQAQHLSAIADAERRPEAKAQMVYRQLVYGKHPYGRPDLGTRKSVTPLTAADCRAFHRRVFVPSNTVMAVVGDFPYRPDICCHQR